MDLLGAILVVVLFAILLQVVRLVHRTKEAVSIAQQAVAILGDASLSDDDKEHALQRYALRLLGLFLVLSFGSLFALFSPLALIWLTESVGLFSLAGVVDILLRWDFVIAAAILGSAVYLVSDKYLR